MRWGLHLCCCQSHLPQPQALEREAQGSPEEPQLGLNRLHGKDPRHWPASAHTLGAGHGEGKERGSTEAEPELRPPTLTVQPAGYRRHPRPCALETVLSNTSAETRV